MHAAAPVDHA
jgi:hypothetical protein